MFFFAGYKGWDNWDNYAENMNISFFAVQSSSVTRGRKNEQKKNCKCKKGGNSLHMVVLFVLETFRYTHRSNSVEQRKRQKKKFDSGYRFIMALFSNEIRERCKIFIAVFCWLNLARICLDVIYVCGGFLQLRQ